LANVDLDVLVDPLRYKDTPSIASDLHRRESGRGALAWRNHRLVRRVGRVDAQLPFVKDLKGDFGRVTMLDRQVVTRLIVLVDGLCVLHDQ
uniref:hypothetical protein n=1 Tax=Klebsiella michiganensis TaxID=1134687 RepID=UPI001954D8A1